MALALTALALLFLANIVFVISSRTTLVVFPVMLIVLALQRLSWKGGIAFVLAASVLAVAAGSASPFLRYRTLLVIDEVTRYHSEDAETSAGYRLEFWKKSIEFVAQAPLIGHGTGSTKTLFRAAASGTGISAAFTDNPHNQTLIIAVQLGLIGVALLYAMWFAHALMFRGGDWPHWVGLGVVVQTMVSAVFNSQLFYFTPGWIYVFGVGVLGGMVLTRQRITASAPIAGSGPTTQAASAADLKFLHHLRPAHFRNFKSKSGTRTIGLLVPLCFRSSCPESAAMYHELRTRGTRSPEGFTELPRPGHVAPG